MVVATFLLGPL